MDINTEDQPDTGFLRGVNDHTPTSPFRKGFGSGSAYVWGSALLSWGVAFCVALLVLVGAFRLLVFSDVFHTLEHRCLGTAQHFAQVSPMAIVDQLQNYFRRPGPELMDQPLFSYRERLHYLEVKQIIGRTKAVAAWAMAGLIGLALPLVYRTRRVHDGAVGLVVAVSRKVSVVLVGVLGICGFFALDFESHFFWLHTRLFDSRNWLLPPYAATVQLFPLRYFTDFMLTYMGLVLAVAILIPAGISYALAKIPTGTASPHEP